MAHVGVRILEQVSTHVRLDEVTDVARAVLRDEAVDRTLRARGAEPVGMADDPGGHVAAVGSAYHAEALRVAEVEAAKRLVDDGHQVLVVHRAPAGPALDRAADRPTPLLAVAGRS